MTSRYCMGNYNDEKINAEHSYEVNAGTLVEGSNPLVTGDMIER